MAPGAHLNPGLAAPNMGPMTKPRFAPGLRPSLLPALVAFVGCNLISPAATTVKFDLPPKTFTVDASDGSMVKLPPGGVPAVACSKASDCCTSMGMSIDCTTYAMSCEAMACVLSDKVQVAQSINLAMEVPQLQSLGTQKVADVTLSSITYQVTSNTLNVDLPATEIWVAPDGVTTVSTADAKKLGVIPMIPKGTTPTMTVVFVPEYKEIFAAYAVAYQRPFNVIGVTTVKVKAGQAAPSGKMEIVLTGQAEASLKLPAE